jgi:branched-chain amino acid transport system ATP-binding protein
MAPRPLIELRGLTKSLGGRVIVHGVDLAVRQAEVTALIGPNGAGKSTLFNLLTGQLRPDAGRVEMLGREVTGWSPRAIWRLGVGRTFQIARAFGSFTVQENVQIALHSHAGRGLRPFGPAARADAEPARALLERTGIADLAGRPAADLAYGDLKRLDLALALAHAPRLLLMDEPTAGMAPDERRGLIELVLEISGERELGVLFTEHDMDIVFGHARRVVVMAAGRFIADGSPEQIRADARVREVYLGGAEEGER